MLEVDTFFLAAARKHGKGDDGKYDTNPLIQIQYLAINQQGTHEGHYRSGGIDRSHDGERQVFHAEITEDPAAQYDETLEHDVLVNFRRDGYDFDARWDEGLASHKDKELYETIANEKAILSKRLKETLNYRKGGSTGFETCVTRLQMQGYVCIADFVYMQDKYGRPYGWGVAEYTTPETIFGYDYATSAYRWDPQESRARMQQHLRSLLPNVSETLLEKIIRG